MTESLRSWKRRGVCVRASCPLPLRELLKALQQTFQKRLQLPAALQPHKPPAPVHSFACSRIAGGPRRVPGPRTSPHTLQPLRTSALGINLSPFQISPVPPPHHLRSSTPPPGPSGRLRLHSFSSLPIYTSQHMSDAFQGSPSASSQCLPCPRAHTPVLAVPSGSHILQSCQWQKEFL